MNEFEGEDMIISDEKYSEKHDNKYLPRSWMVESASKKHSSFYKIDRYQMKNTLSPE
jgi:hypothetical protein